VIVLVLLVLAAAVTVVAAVWNAIHRRRLVRRIHDLGALPGVDGLPGQAAIDSGELGRGTAGGGINQGGFGGWG
jgi:hypothetical protein